VGRSVLVTGGNRGIGWEVARAFVALGDNVAITYRSGEPPDGVFAVRADVTDLTPRLLRSRSTKARLRFWSRMRGSRGTHCFFA
jgi:NAD(P)-dependent dehydrogenase (short-subunit alcohol dehydrogenase family)